MSGSFYNTGTAPCYNTLYVVIGKSVEELHYDYNIFANCFCWMDSLGTIWASAESSNSSDDIDRCGVCWFSLSPKHKFTPACKVHDFSYSSPVYQAFHSRKEADIHLKKQLEILSGNKLSYKLLINPFYFITRIFGRFFWENKNNR